MDNDITVGSGRVQGRQYVLMTKEIFREAEIYIAPVQRAEWLSQGYDKIVIGTQEYFLIDPLVLDQEKLMKKTTMK